MYDYFFRKVCSGQNILQKVPFARAKVGVQNYFIQSVGVIFTLKAHSRGASVPFGLGHIARYAPSPEGNICAPIMHFQCKNNFEHLLISSKSVGGILGRLVNLFANFANPFLNQDFGDMHCIDSYHLILNTCL